MAGRRGQGSVQRDDRSRALEWAPDDHAQGPEDRHRRIGRRVGAPDRPAGQSRRVLRVVATPWFGPADRPSDGRRAGARIVSFLLDTNVVSEWAKPRPEPGVVAWLAATDEDEVFMSVVSFAELNRGVGLMPVGQRRNRLLDWIAYDLTA